MITNLKLQGLIALPPALLSVHSLFPCGILIVGQQFEGEFEKSFPIQDCLGYYYLRNTKSPFTPA